MISTWASACGIATYSANLIEELEKLDVNVEVFSDTTNFNSLVKLAKDCSADVVHIQHEFGISITAEALLSLIGKFRIMGKPVVITLHTEAPLFNVLIDGVADAVILHNDKAGMVAKNTFSKFLKIPHGIPEISFKEDKKYYRKKYGIPEDAFVIGTCGFLTNDRGQFIENLVTHMKDFVGKNKDIYLNFPTSSHRSDGDGNFAKMVRSSLMNLASQYGFEDRVYVGTSFMDTKEFRERLYCLDLGVAHSPNIMVSNSGAAADIISCGVPVVVNDVPHFSHIAPYCKVVGDDILDMVEAVESIYTHRDHDEMRELITKAQKAPKDIGYSAVAKTHKELYEKLHHNYHALRKEEPKVSSQRVLKKDKPVTITCPNSMWQILLLWRRLQTLVNDGHKIHVVLQEEGIMDVSILKYVLNGIFNVSFTDVGLQNDPRLARLHSRSLAQNMTTDVSAFLSRGERYKDLFGFIPEADKVPMFLGDFAHKRAMQVVPSNSIVLNVTSEDCLKRFPDLLRRLYDRGKVFKNFIILGTPLEQELTRKAFNRFAMDRSANIHMVIEDTRTRWAVCMQADAVMTEFNDVAIFCMMSKKFVVVDCDHDWQGTLIEDLSEHDKDDCIIYDRYAEPKWNELKKKEKEHVNV